MYVLSGIANDAIQRERVLPPRKDGRGVTRPSLTVRNARVFALATGSATTKTLRGLSEKSVRSGSPRLT